MNSQDQNIKKMKQKKNKKISFFKKRKSTEINGPKGLEPTRYGDWERNGRCSDF